MFVFWLGSLGSPGSLKFLGSLGSPGSNLFPGPGIPLWYLSPLVMGTPLWSPGPIVVPRPHCGAQACPIVVPRPYYDLWVPLGSLNWPKCGPNVAPWLQCGPLAPLWSRALLWSPLPILIPGPFCGPQALLWVVDHIKVPRPPSMWSPGLLQCGSQAPL